MKAESFVYFCIGAALGAIAAVLFTPQSGAETREYLRASATDAATQVKDQAGKWRDSARDSARDMLERTKGTLKKKADMVSDAVDAGKQAFREAAEPVS